MTHAILLGNKILKGAGVNDLISVRVGLGQNILNKDTDFVPKEQGRRNKKSNLVSSAGHAQP